MYFVLFFIFIVSCLIFYAFLKLIHKKEIVFTNRLSYLEELYKDNESDKASRAPFKIRVLNPLFQEVKKIIYGLTPEAIRNDIQKKLRAASYPFGASIDGWMIFKFAMGILLPIFFASLLLLGKIPLILKLFLVSIFTSVCWAYPNVFLRRRIDSRNKRIVQQLPDILDLLTVSVEAGLSFEGAMAQVVEKANGELAQEFEAAINEIQLGKSRREALTNMAKRCDILDLTTFISSIVQAEQLGAAMGKILRVQATQMRDKRRQRAREQAMKAPVKMLLPLVFFIFPTIFIVILCPAIIQISKNL